MILITHGEPLWNENNLFTCCVDLPLTTKGVEETVESAKRISNIPIGMIYTSALILAQMTGMLAMAQHHRKNEDTVDALSKRLMKHRVKWKLQRRKSKLSCEDLAAWNFKRATERQAMRANERSSGEAGGRNVISTADQVDHTTIGPRSPYNDVCNHEIVDQIQYMNFGYCNSWCRQCNISVVMKVEEREGDNKISALPYVSLLSQLDGRACGLNINRSILNKQISAVFWEMIRSPDDDDTYHLHPQKSLYNTKLRNATVKGCWGEAKAILKNNIDAATELISKNGNTMLHLAVVKGHNNFLEKLHNFIKKEEHIERRNSDGHTALHIAVIFDIRCAAELLVRKRKRLLQISDNEDNIPLLSAYNNMKLSTYVYLLEVSEADSVHLPLGRYSDSHVQIGVNFIITAIFTKQYDLAMKLINIYPELVRKDDQVLMAAAITFPRKLGFGEESIHPSSKHAHGKIVTRRISLLLDSYNFLCKRAEDVIWSMRSFKSMYYIWLLTDIV
ncbi:Ankyrin repeat-containing protein [Artemisia annua]|uniref:Ankyrin repeat-containing protein n=1 Tax=Artemisia annua TaxID=35608 RepID=A0A2U1QMH2_ARTAN|nr:Ankyrin repeat-containing protein [Artemisia annua]